MLKKGFCKLVKETAQYFQKMPELLNPVLVIVLSMSESIKILDESIEIDIGEFKKMKELLELLYVQTLMQLCLHCAT